jgi:hypothetical protein
MATKAKKVSVKAAAKTSNPAGVIKTAKLSEEDIRFRAYEIFQARVSEGQPGNEMSDWLQAERELVNTALRAGAGRQPRA